VAARPSDGGTPGGGVTSAEADARRLAWALFPVRLFLGVTFIYGGIQKLSDPGFLHPGAPTYIGTQLRGFANGTPGGFLLRTFAIPHPKVSGVGVALVEIAVGLLVSTGLLTRAAAAVGLALNLLLFLTNSWHQRDGRRGERRGSRDRGHRRAVAAPARGLPAGANPQRLGAARPDPVGQHTRHANQHDGQRDRRQLDQCRQLGSGSRTGPSPGAVKLGAASELPAGQAATYADPGDGQPDIVIRQTNGTLVAHSAVCTHAGCTVGYQGGQLLCPCHGSVFNAQTGAVITGPAVTPLPARTVIQHAGEIYALPA
jgi:thiosulfate dehydrogenase [quinone] large subunit